MAVQSDYFRKSTQEAAKFFTALQTNSVTKGVFDSAAALDFMSSAINQAGEIRVPEKLQIVLDEAGAAQQNTILRAIIDSAAAYEAANGCSVPGDVIEQAIHSAYATTQDAIHRYSLDSANSLYSDPLSLQPNRAVVSIVSTIAEAIPWANYLPADIGSNEAKLAIVTHHAGSTFGAYSQGDILDGIGSGDAYISSSRVNTSYPSDGAVSGKITAIQTDADTCDQDADDLKVLLGRTIVYVNGREAARENLSSPGTTSSPISGTIVIDGTSYAISGTIDTDTGEYSLTSSPSLPDDAAVTVEAFVDFERDGDLTPLIVTNVNTYKLYAKPWRAITKQSIDARTQMANELGLDPMSEAIIAINTQYNNERHKEALRKGLRLAVNNTETFDYYNAEAHQDEARAEVWRDFAYPLSVVSQQMAEDTINHGVTHMYVGKRVASQLAGMPNDVWTPSGVVARPGIYRLGRLFNLVDVYYTPWVLEEDEDNAQILCVGRATDVARNPIVFGDAVPPTMIPLAVNADLRQGAGYYARNFTAVNPHGPSSLGFALINVTNMGITSSSSESSDESTDETESE